MKTTISKMIEWCIENAFNIEDQAGIQYIAIDYEDFRINFNEWLEKEKQQIINAYQEGESQEGWNDDIPAEQYYEDEYINSEFDE